MKKQFNLKSEKRHYEVPDLDWTVMEAEAGFFGSTEESVGTTDFNIDNEQNDESLWN